MSKRVIGLTGGIGSGKTTVANEFANLGVDLVDADLLSREVVESGSPALLEISKHFGAQILDDSKNLNRQELRKIVFEKKEEKVWLENLLHPLIRDLMLSRLASANSPYVMLVSPLLLETDQHQLVERILVIDVSVETQLQRTLQRDQSNIDTIRAIIASQIDRDSRLKLADDVLNNEEPMATVQQKVLELHNKYLLLGDERRD